MGLNEIPLDGANSILADDLIDFHPDPADRLIVVTALTNEALLVTADQRILDWRGTVQRIHAVK